MTKDAKDFLMVRNKLRQGHTGIIRIVGYRDTCDAMTHPKAARGASPAVHQKYNFQHQINFFRKIKNNMLQSVLPKYILNHLLADQQCICSSIKQSVKQKDIEKLFYTTIYLPCIGQF